MKAKRTAVGYVRVSRVGGRGGDSFLSPDLQREEIARAAHREGLEVAEIEELDASGGDSKRPVLNRALAMVERGEAAAVVVYNIEQLVGSLGHEPDHLFGAGVRPDPGVHKPVDDLGVVGAAPVMPV